MTRRDLEFADNVVSSWDGGDVESLPDPRHVCLFQGKVVHAGEFGVGVEGVKSKSKKFNCENAHVYTIRQTQNKMYNNTDGICIV